MHASSIKGNEDSATDNFMKKCTVLFMLIAAMSLTGCNLSASHTVSENSESIESTENTEQSEQDIQTTDVSELYSIDSSIMTLGDNSCLSITCGAAEKTYLIIVDGELGNSLYNARNYIYLTPTVEENTEYAEELYKDTVFTYAYTLYPDEMDALTEKYETICTEENFDEMYEQMFSDVSAILSEDDLNEIKASLESTEYYSLTDYICFNKDGNSLGKLTSSEIDEFVKINKNTREDEMLERQNDAVTLSENVNVSELSTKGVYLTTNEISITNDTGAHIKIEYLVKDDFTGEYADNVEYIAGQFLYEGPFCDNEVYVDGNALVCISIANADEILENTMEANVIKASEMQKGTEYDPMGYDLLYNDTNKPVTIFSECGKSITIGANEISGISWISLGNIWR